MPTCSTDLHGNVPESCPVALLIVDMMNDFDFPGGDSLLRQALPAALQIARLKKKARRRGVPVIYVNDNFGRWRSDFRQQVDHCLAPDAAGRPIASLLKPESDDYFVLKAKHSAFFATPLDLLLQHLGARTLVLTGVTGDSCITFTAHDAYMRDYALILPQDAIASIDARENTSSLERLERLVDAHLMPSLELDFRLLTKTTKSGKGKRSSG